MYRLFHNYLWWTLLDEQLQAIALQVLFPNSQRFIDTRVWWFIGIAF
jgi:hypothetical protein